MRLFVATPHVPNQSHNSRARAAFLLYYQNMHIFARHDILHEFECSASKPVNLPTSRFIHSSWTFIELTEFVYFQQAASLEKVLKEQQQQQQLELERAWDQDREVKGNGSTSPASDHRVQEHSPPPASDAQKNLNAAQPVSQVTSRHFLAN